MPAHNQLHARIVSSLGCSIGFEVEQKIIYPFFTMTIIIWYLKVNGLHSLLFKLPWENLRLPRSFVSCSFPLLRRNRRSYYVISLAWQICEDWSIVPDTTTYNVFTQVYDLFTKHEAYSRSETKIIHEESKLSLSASPLFGSMPYILLLIHILLLYYSCNHILITNHY